MSGQGASLQNNNNQLVTYLEELKEQRDNLDQQIHQKTTAKESLESRLGSLTERLAEVNQSLEKKHQTKNEYDRAIQETENAYMKIIESAHSLLNVVRKESSSLSKKSSDD